MQSITNVGSESVMVIGTGKLLPRSGLGFGQDYHSKLSHQLREATSYPGGFLTNSSTVNSTVHQCHKGDRDSVMRKQRAQTWKS